MSAVLFFVPQTQKERDAFADWFVDDYLPVEEGTPFTVRLWTVKNEWRVWNLAGKHIPGFGAQPGEDRLVGAPNFKTYEEAVQWLEDNCPPELHP